MNIKEKLLDIINNKILLDLEDDIDDIFEIIASKKDTEEDRNEVKILQELKKDFAEIVEDINQDDMEEDEYEELYGWCLETIQKPGSN